MNAAGETGTRFGPEPHHYDPYDHMSDEELDAELDDVLRREPPSVTISIRMPAELLERTKRLAAAGGLPYQALIKRLVDAGVSRLEQRAERRRANEGAPASNRRKSTELSAQTVRAPGAAANVEA